MMMVRGISRFPHSCPSRAYVGFSLIQAELDGVVDLGINS